LYRRLNINARSYENPVDLAVRNGLDPALKPETLDISETRRWLGDKSQYSLKNLLQEMGIVKPQDPPEPEI
jgi:hypothetical protein